MHEQRAHNRRLMREDAVLSNEVGGARRPVIMLDISRLGVCFTSSTLLESGTRHLLEFNLPGTGPVHETVVQVVHSSESGVPSGYKVGARFIHIEAETTESIVHFVSHATPA